MSEYEGKYIKVKILEGGKTAREVNPLGEEPDKLAWLANKFVTTIKWDKWQEAESKLRTFQIDLPSSKIHSSIWIGDHWKYQLDLSQQFSIHQAEILPNGKVRIL